MVYENEKRGKQEIFLLTIFFVGIILSYMVVRHRNRVVLSEPIQLNSTGLAVPLPIGKIWQSEGKWQFNGYENSFTLLSSMLLSGKIEGQLMCNYYIAPELTDIDERLAQQAAQVKASIVDKGQIQLGWTTVQWAQLTVKSAISDSFIGIADLPDGRSIQLLVVMESNPKGAWQLFSAVWGEIKYEHNDLLNNGKLFTARLKRIGTKQLIETETNGSNKRVYLIEKADSSTDNNDLLGFAIDTFSDGDYYNDRGSVSGESFYHLAGRREANNNIGFEINGDFDRFNWHSKYIGKSGRGNESAQVELDDTGSMKVVSLTTPGERTCWPGEVSVPEMLLDSAVRAFIDIESGPVVIDLVIAKGWIMPTKLQMATAEDIGKWPGERAGYGVVIEYIYSQDSKQYIFFDEDKNILGKIDPSGQQVVWHRIDGSELLNMQQFLPWREDIERLLSNEKEI